MNAVNIVCVEIVVVSCPCASPRCEYSPLADLADRLRCEMRYGRRQFQDATVYPSVTVAMLAAFYRHPERN